MVIEEKTATYQEKNSCASTASHNSIVQSLFSRIARKYELTNDLISLGLHRRWLKALQAMVVERIIGQDQPLKIADLCGGTGAVTLSLLKSLKVKKKSSLIEKLYLVDFCPEMLEIGQKQIEKLKTSQGISTDVSYLCDDVCESEIATQSIDLITMAYGLRNILDRNKVYSEIKRLLKEEGDCFILELTKPSSWVRHFHKVYLSLILPLFSYLLTRDKKAYAYLVHSIRQFPSNDHLYSEIEASGLKIAGKKTFLFGTCTLLHLKRM